MRSAFDFSTVPGPSTQEIVANGGEGALCYGTGQQQDPAYIAGLEASGLHVPLIWEHNTDSILGGYDYGVSECQAWEASHPTGLVYLACDLNDGALAGRDLTGFLNGWASVTREPCFGVYGSDDALNQARTVPKAQRFWGVVNWIRGGGPDNTPSNIDFWTSWGAHLIQLIGSPIPNTDQNMILRDDWWTTGVAPTEVTKPMYDYFATSPWDATQTQIWWFSCAGHRYVPADEWAVIKAKAALSGQPEPKAFKGTPAMFNGSRDVNAAVSGGAVAPTKVTSTVTSVIG